MTQALPTYTNNVKMHFFADFDCLVCISSTVFFELEQQKPKTVQADCSPAAVFLVSVYPVLGPKFIPYSFKINACNASTECEFAVIKKFDGENMEIRLLPFILPLKKDFFAYRFAFNNQDFSATLNKDAPANLTVEAINGTMLCVPLNFAVKTASFNVIGNFLIVSGAASANLKNYCIILNLKTGTAELTGTFDKVELNLKERTISTLSKCGRLLQHGQVIHYVLNEALTVKEKYSVYLNATQPLAPRNPLFAPFAFFDAVKCEDYTCARALLAPPLAERLTNRHLKEFFNEYETMEQNPYCNDSSLLLFPHGKDKCGTLFIFKLGQNNLIENIISN